MKISQTIVRVLTLSMAFWSTGSYAGNSVIGKVSAESTVMLNPGPSQQRLGTDQFPYIAGQLVSTIGSDSAQIILGAGQANVTLAPESTASIDAASPLKLTLKQGAVGFVSPAGSDVTIDSPRGTFVLTSANGINAVAVFQDGELAIMPRSGNLAVEASNGDSFALVNSENAFVSSQLNSAQVVDVLEGENGILIAILAAAAVIAGIIIISDDNDPTSP